MSKESQQSTPGIDFLTTLVEINHEITSILDLDPLLQKIAEMTARFIPYKVFAILLVDQASDELYYRFAIGHSSEVVSLRVPIGQGIVGTAALEKRPIVVDDVSEDHRYINVISGTRSELAVPLISKNRLLGVLDIESPEIASFPKEQVRMLHTLASQIAIAIDNAELYESERRNRQMLTLLHDISLEVASTLDVDDLINKIASAVKSAVEYHILSVLMLDEHSRTLKCRMVFRQDGQEREMSDVPMGSGLVGTAALENRPVRVGDVRQDNRYIGMHGETISEMAIPLAFKGKVLGVLDLQSPEKNHFSEFDERLLMTLATRIASALTNAELYKRVADNEKRFNHELEIARQIQRQLLPKAIPQMGHLQLATSFTPVAHLGGDLYDLIQFDDGRVAIVVGDVSGKSVPAALYAALASGIIRTRAVPKYEPAQMLELVNKSLGQRPIASQYLALVYAIYDQDQRKLTLANSGLPFPIFVHGDECGFLDVAGIPLGLFPHSQYQETVLDLKGGDLVVFYTDGVVERTDSNGEEFGLGRLAKVVGLNRREAPDAIVRAIEHALQAHNESGPAHDDQTILVMKMSGEDSHGGPRPIGDTTS